VFGDVPFDPIERNTDATDGSPIVASSPTPWLVIHAHRSRHVERSGHMNGFHKSSPTPFSRLPLVVKHSATVDISSLDCEHGCVGRPSHPFRDATDEKMLDARSTMSPDDDEIHVVYGHIVDDRLVSCPIQNLALYLQATRPCPFADLVDDRPSRVLDFGKQSQIARLWWWRSLSGRRFPAGQRYSKN
jgi:hypothetical protein